MIENNSKKFKDIFDKIEMVEMIYPMLRLTQIINIAANKAGWKSNDLFYCPEEIILDGLNQIINEKI